MNQMQHSLRGRNPKQLARNLMKVNTTMITVSQRGVGLPRYHASGIVYKTPGLKNETPLMESLQFDLAST